MRDKRFKRKWDWLARAWASDFPLSFIPFKRLHTGVIGAPCKANQVLLLVIKKAYFERRDIGVVTAHLSRTN